MVRWVRDYGALWLDEGASTSSRVARHALGNARFSRYKEWFFLICWSVKLDPGYIVFRTVVGQFSWDCFN